MLEVDARNGIESMRNDGTAPGSEDNAAAIGTQALEDIANAFDLDAGELMGFARSHGEMQAGAMLAALRIDLTGDGQSLVFGSTIGGILTGLRVGLLIADARRDGP